MLREAYLAVRVVGDGMQNNPEGKPVCMTTPQSKRHFIEQSIRTLTADLAVYLVDHSLMFACAESCTGGWLAKSCTDLAGSSQWFDRSFVTYSNEAKQQMLGVDAALIKEHGAVSEAVAAAMLSGLIENSLATIGVSITGIAGPGGGTEQKPVGTVCFGFAVPGESPLTETCCFQGDRELVRLSSVEYVLKRLLVLVSAGA